MTRNLKSLLLWSWFAVLLAVVPVATGPALRAQDGNPHPTPAAAPQQQDQHHAPRTLDMPAGDFFKKQYSHSVPYKAIVPQFSDDPKVNESLAIYNVNKFQWWALLLLAIFLPVKWSFGDGRNPGRVVRIFRGWCLWIRDEMVYAVMGKEEGNRFAPYFIFQFFFIAAMNCIGLIPSWDGLWSTYTATGTPYVTGALALCTLFTMLFFGIRENGAVGFFKSLIPHGLPAWLLPLMIVVELVGLLVKPFALTIRLFANMLAGHLVIASLIGLIFLFAKMQDGAATSYLTAVPALGMTIFIYIIEAFVTLLQAYIFTYLSIIFLHQAMHPAH